MAAGQLRAVVATGSLDLGIDWGAVDLVIQVGAPKNVKRLVQRIGRANHRYNAPSRAILVPANRFEVVECQAALDAVRDHALDGEPRGPGPLDVALLEQDHVLLDDEVAVVAAGDDAVHEPGHVEVAVAQYGDGEAVRAALAGDALAALWFTQVPTAARVEDHRGG